MRRDMIEIPPEEEVAPHICALPYNMVGADRPVGTLLRCENCKTWWHSKIVSPYVVREWRVVEPWNLFLKKRIKEAGYDF
jgi:hypothetical protein